MPKEFDYSKLRGRIKEKYDTISNFAKELGIGRGSFSNKINNYTEFTAEEIYISCKLLEIPIEELHKYFFKEKVQKTEQTA